MAYFPFYIDIENKKILVVGGGTVALRKIEKLTPFSPDITVVAPKICDEIKALNVKSLTADFVTATLTVRFALSAQPMMKRSTAEFFSFAMRKIFLSTQLTIRKNADLFFLQLQAKTA